MTNPPATDTAGLVEKLTALHGINLARPHSPSPPNGGTSEEWESWFAANQARSRMLDLMPAILTALTAKGDDALRAENERLRSELSKIASCEMRHPQDVVAVARAALGGQP